MRYLHAIDLCPANQVREQAAKERRKPDGFVSAKSQSFAASIAQRETHHAAGDADNTFNFVLLSDTHIGVRLLSFSQSSL
jgi:hypothetical protein